MILIIYFESINFTVIVIIMMITVNVLGICVHAWTLKLEALLFGAVCVQQTIYHYFLFEKKKRYKHV